MKHIKKKRERKGIYLLPNLLTSISLLSGFYAIVVASGLERQFYIAAIAIFISCIFDMLDGRVARLTHSTSKFGVEYDSLSDVIAFGVAPAVLVYNWALRGYGRFGWLAAFLFVACGAMRLARFNIQVDTVQKKSFLGLPIPAAAAAIAGYGPLLQMAWISGDIQISQSIRFRSCAVSHLCPRLPHGEQYPLLQLQRHGLFQGKTIRFHTHRHCSLLFIIVIEPEFTLFVGTLGYVISGPVYTLILKLRKPVPEETTRLKEKPIGSDGHL